MDIIFLAAGKGTRFSSVDSELPPKPAIPVMGQTMLEFSYKNIMSLVQEKINYDPLVIYSSNHSDAMGPIVERLVANDSLLDGRVIEQDGFVNGPSESALLAEKRVAEDAELLLVNCDQYIEVDLIKIIREVREQNLDGAILTFENDNPRYSYVITNDDGVATSMVEKEVVSSKASCGIILWRNAKDFFKYANKLKTEVVDRERYISDVCHLAISDGLKFSAPMVDVFIDLGTPADLENLEEKWDQK